MKNYEVFISHSHKDKVVADAICHYFEDEKIKCWIAPRDIKPGTNWAEAIAGAIPSCRVFLLVFSSHANMSHQVLREVELAVKNKLVIVPVRIEDTAPSGGMEYYLSTVHWIDVVNKKTEKYIKNLAETVKSFLEAEGNMPAPVGNHKVFSNKGNKRAVWITTAAVVALLAVLGFIFRGSLFGGANDNPDALANNPTETVEMTTEPTAEPTPVITAEPTVEPTATIDPNISLDTIVDIPDVGLKTAVLRTLDAMGEQVIGNITVGDMRKLTTLIIVSGDSYDPEAIHRLPGYDTYPIALNTQIKSLEGLQYASDMVQLSVGAFGLEDISALSTLYKLEVLDISGNNVEDISALANLGSLTMLSCDGNNISDISSMILLYNIEKLFIHDNPISDIEPLRDMRKMTSLAIGSMNLSDISSLSNMTNLKQLSLSHNPLDNIDAISNLTELKVLLMVNCGLTDISELSALTNLQELNVLDNNIIDASSLENLGHLEAVLMDEDTQKLNQETVDKLTQQGCEVFDHAPDEYGE